MSKVAKTCGSCIHFDKERLEGEKKLHNEDRKEYSRPCQHYEVNPEPVSRNIDHLQNLAHLIRGVPSNKLENLAQMVLAAGKLAAYGYQFMQPVVVRWRGAGHDNYLNNFMVAHIVTINPSKRIARLTSYNGEIALSFPLSSLIPLPKFDKMRKKMIAEGRLRDPRYRHSDYPAASFTEAELMTVRTIVDVVGDMDQRSLQLERGPGKVITQVRKAKRKAKKNRRVKPLEGDDSHGFTVTNR